MNKIINIAIFLLMIITLSASEEKIETIESSNGNYILTISGKPGLTKKYINAVELTLSDSTGTEFWTKKLRYYGRPAVSNLGECAIPTGVRTQTAIDFFDIKGNFIGKFDCKKTTYYMYTNTNSNEQIHAYSFDGKNFCFFTHLEVWKKNQLWFLDNHGIEQWKYELDTNNFPVSVEVLKNIVYLKTIKRFIERKQGKSDKYITVHNFKEETHLIDIHSGKRLEDDIR